MAEIGTIASIIGVAGAGFRLSIVLHAVSCEVANAGLEVHALSRGVSLFSLILKQVGTVLQANDSVHSHEALDAAKQVADECKLVFDEIEHLIDKVRGRRPDGSMAVGQKIKWAFKKGRVAYLMGQLESLKLNLSLMLQILQLGKLMAATSKSDTQEEVNAKMNAIQQERFETQNIVIVRYWHIHEVDVLKEEYKRETAEEKQAEIESPTQNLLESPTQHLLTNGVPLLAIESPQEQGTSMIRLPGRGLAELDQTFERLGQSQTPRDMMAASDQLIEPLLEHWTVWNEVRERRHTRNSFRFTPSVQNLHEEDEDRPFHQTYQEREESPRGLYLEGTTTDWRKPHSAAAKREAAILRKRYSGYQPGVSADSSEVDDSPGSKGSKKKSARNHVISSESDSSDDEDPRMAAARNRRRSSGSPTTQKRPQFDGPPLSHSYSAGQAMGSRRSPGATPPYTTPRSSIVGQPQHTLPHRPAPTPNQTPFHHSISSPLPPINTSNAPNPYATSGPYSPNQQLPPYSTLAPQSQAASRYIPQSARIPLPPRPVSQDGKSRSPSRLSGNSYPPPAGNPNRVHVKTEEEIKAARHRAQKNLREGATKGILGAGALAGFLEVLEGL